MLGARTLGAVKPLWPAMLPALHGDLKPSPAMLPAVHGMQHLQALVVDELHEVERGEPAW